MYQVLITVAAWRTNGVSTQVLEFAHLLDAHRVVATINDNKDDTQAGCSRSALLLNPQE